MDDDDDRPLAKPRPTVSLQDVVLRLLDQDLGEAAPSTGRQVEGQVIWVGKGACRVRAGSEILECEISGDLARDQQTSVAVGDRAVVIAHEDVNAVRTIRPRRTTLSRPDPGNPYLERVLVANVDVIVVTVSVKTPPLHPRLIDRFLVAIQRGGAEPVVCVNKLDLVTQCERQSELAKLAPYVDAGVSVVCCSAYEGAGLEEVDSIIAGKVVAFVGHSGVGKSSIVNALAPHLKLDTGGISEGYGRGRHTTTASSLHDIGNGTQLIDTPGIRSFGLWKMSAQEIVSYFPEFKDAANQCRFRNCSHLHEPGCAVQAAIADGLISPHRYETYRRLATEG